MAARQKQLEIRVWLSSHCNVYRDKQLLKYSEVQSLKHCSYLSLAFGLEISRSKYFVRNSYIRIFDKSSWPSLLLDVPANVFARY